MVISNVSKIFYKYNKISIINSCVLLLFATVPPSVQLEERHRGGETKEAG